MIIKLAGIVLLSAVAFMLLKKDRADFAFILEICVTVGLLILILPYLENVISLFSNLMGKADLDSGYSEILIKGCGIAIVSKLICELCKDAGECALSAKFELAAKVLILISALPIFEALFALISAFAEKML